MVDIPDDALEPSASEMEEMKQRYYEAEKDRKLLALHEAGHAAVACHFNMGVKRVVLQGMNTSYTETDRRQPSRQMLHNELVMLLAGYRAVLKETNEVWIANIHSGIDFGQMYKIFDELSIGVDEQTVWMKTVEPVCENLIDTYWPAIRKIAAILEQNGQMSGSDVCKTISGK